MVNISSILKIKKQFFLKLIYGIQNSNGLTESIIIFR